MSTRIRRSARIEAALQSATTPVFLFDDERRLSFFNAACEALTGWKADDLLGRVCEYRTDADPTSADFLLGAIGPPPSALAGREAVVPAYVPHRNGSHAARRIHFFPLAERAGASSVLGLMAELQTSPRTPPVPLSQQLHAELASVRASIRRRFGPQNFVARGAPMQRVLQQVELAARSTLPVLIRGAAGTGREHLARMIHARGETGARSFVPLDCRRLSPAELKETLKRLFEQTSDGHGRPSLDLPGTAYLAEVDRLGADLQEWLVTAIGRATLESATTRNERPDRAERLERTAENVVPAMRLIVGTIRDPRELLALDVLRPEFFYLVTTIELVLPSLVERMDELDLLAQHFLEAENRGRARPLGGLDPAVRERFREYRWPGNLDELELVVREAAAKCSVDAIRLDDLPLRFRAGIDAQSVGPPPRSDVEPLEPLLQRIETDCIRQALERSGRNKSRAAERLGLTRARLYRRMKELGIEDEPDA